MGVKTITITEEAYRLLAREKTGDESFSQVIKRLTNERGSLRDSLGGWRMSADEEAEIFSDLRAHWKKTTTKLRGTGKKYS
ncbi:MAG TPA: antitoxin VapB family protein [Candidatus Bathyarchaeia archaeon]|nr:antitoxin VapB family protein [Candidatus Bathyarchaeia archaeon]